MALESWEAMVRAEREESEVAEVQSVHKVEAEELEWDEERVTEGDLAKSSMQAEDAPKAGAVRFLLHFRGLLPLQPATQR